MPRFFNTAGPCRPEYNYMLPAVERIPEARELIDEQSYFVVHAPRQTGKTTTIRALAEELTAEGEYAALAFSCESARVAADDFVTAERMLLDVIRERADDALAEDLCPPTWPAAADGNLLRSGLRAWVRVCPRPVVLFFDEIDALGGQSLISVLSQLRSGYYERPESFPWSVVLCGMRDVKDYKAASGAADPPRLGSSSPFNIKTESLRLAEFTRDEIAELYGQHTADTGQVFTSDGVDYAFELTAGQPWLVNALAREVTRKMRVPLDEPVGPRRLDVARERLIRDRATHLDSLVARLNEPRVQRMISPLLTGESVPVAPVAPSASVAESSDHNTYDDDLSYVCDLGLVAPSAPLRIANPIYAEIIPRVLAAEARAIMSAEPRTYITVEGRLDFRRLLVDFAEFWIAHGEVLTMRDAYYEAAPHLVLMAWLYKVANGGGHVDREAALGSKRVDLLVRWPYVSQAGRRSWQREALELKVWHPRQVDPLADGLGQLDAYLDRLGLPEGTLVIFDRRSDAGPIWERTELSTASTPSGRSVTLLRA